MSRRAVPALLRINVDSCNPEKVLDLIGYDSSEGESRLEVIEMLGYFLLFAGVGIGIGHLVKDQKQALITALVIAALWGLSSRAIWGLVTLGELLLGYFIYGAFLAKKSEPPNGQPEE
jgi:hypothetical protein